MRPKYRNRRLFMILVYGFFLFVGGALLVLAIRENSQYFEKPSTVLAPEFVPKSETFRIGGLVLPGSIEKVGDLTIRFDVIDISDDGPEATLIENQPAISVSYTGVVPDLFQEGKGVVVAGRLAGDEFVASEVLAKHDENYQPVIE